jgi:hypothetical protein
MPRSRTREHAHARDAGHADTTRNLGALAQEGERRARPLGGKSDAAPENVADAPPRSGATTA